MTKQIQDAYICAATRTPVGKAPRGVFKTTRPDDLLAHCLKGLTNKVTNINLSEIGDVLYRTQVLMVSSLGTSLLLFNLLTLMYRQYASGNPGQLT